MNLKRILCPTDFSDNSADAIAYATGLAKGTGATLVFVHVAMPATPFGAEHLYVVLESATAELKKQIDGVKPTDPSVPFEHHLLEGHPADAIVEFAKHHDIDLIVIGTHGRTGLSRLLMGSIAEEVVRRSACPTTR